MFGEITLFSWFHHFNSPFFWWFNHHFLHLKTTSIATSDALHGQVLLLLFSLLLGERVYGCHVVKVWFTNGTKKERRFIVSDRKRMSTYFSNKKVWIEDGVRISDDKR